MKACVSGRDQMHYWVGCFSLPHRCKETHLACWGHAMDTFSTLLALCEGNPLGTSGFPSQRASNVKFFSVVNCLLKKPLNKHWNCQLFEKPWHSCDVTVTPAFDVMMTLNTRGSSYKLHMCVCVASLCLLMTCSYYHCHKNNWYKSY